MTRIRADFRIKTVEAGAVGSNSWIVCSYSCAGILAYDLSLLVKTLIEQRQIVCPGEFTSKTVQTSQTVPFCYIVFLKISPPASPSSTTNPAIRPLINQSSFLSPPSSAPPSSAPPGVSSPLQPDLPWRKFSVTSSSPLLVKICHAGRHQFVTN